ncbi:MAG: hypothetical protein ACOZIN_19665 [Myxococcota bacterium]
MKLRMTAALLLAGAFTAPVTAWAKIRTFPAGSLIIPMDNCWQPGQNTSPAAPCENPEWSGGYTTPTAATFTPKPGNPAIGAPPNSATMTYGTLWFLLRHGITVSWIVNSAKTSIDGVDLQINSPWWWPVAQLNRGAAPYTGTWYYNINPIAPQTTGTVSFKGGPFVIHANEAARALRVLQQLARVPPTRASGGNYATFFANVRIYQAQVSFNGDVAKIMNESMRPVMVNASGTDYTKMSAYMDQSGLDFASATLVDLDSDSCCRIRELASCASATCTIGPAMGRYVSTGTVKPQPFMVKGGFINGVFGGRTHAGPGQVYDVFGDNAGSDAMVDAAYDDKVLSQWRLTDGRLYYTEAWFPHWSSPTGMNGVTGKPNGARYFEEIVNFNKAGGAVISECAGVPSFESPPVRSVTYPNLITSFMSQNGLQRNPGLGSPSGTSGSCVGCCNLASGCGGNICSTPCNIKTTYNPTQFRNLLLQVGDFYFLGTGGNTKSWAPYTVGANRYGAARPAVYSYDPAAGGYKAGVTRLIFGCKNSTGCTGLPAEENDWFTIYKDPANPEAGIVVYLEGDTYDGKTDGIRLVMSSLFGLGFQIRETELARSSPVLHDGNPIVKGEELYQGTFRQSNALLDITTTDTFTSAADANNWVFPSVPGNFREYPTGPIPLLSRKDFEGITITWVAKPKPWYERAVFTHFYCPESAGSATCKADGAPSNPEKAGPFEKELLYDIGSKAVIPPGQLKKLVGVGSAADARALIEQVLRARAGCRWNTTVAPPNVPSFCEATGAYNGDPYDNIRPRLGGIDRSTPVLVPPSAVAGYRNPPGAAKGTRPTIAYFGALDGQVHAVYVSGGDSHPGFSPPAPGTVLWSFLPNSQLTRLRTNSALVDGVLAVSDVFEDFDGTGKRQWRTVLVGTLREGGNRIFALDVTDPTSWDKVEVLWEKGDPQDPTFNTCKLTDVDHSDSAKKTYDVTQPNAAHVLGESAGAVIAEMRIGLRPVSAVIFTAQNRSYLDTDEDGIQDPGEPFVTGTAPPPPWGHPQGFLTLALDIKTGLPLYNCTDKWWHFFRYYNSTVDSTSSWYGMQKYWWMSPRRPNLGDIPPRPTLLDRDQDGITDTVFIPDLEGRVWEAQLTDSERPVNRWFRIKSGKPAFPIPLFDMDWYWFPDPVGVSLAAFRPQSGQNMSRLGVLAVTGSGVDWAPGISYQVIVNADDTRDLATTSMDNDGDGVYDPVDKGAGRIWKMSTAAYTTNPVQYWEETWKGYFYPVGSTWGERVFAAPVIRGCKAYLVTSTGNTAAVKAADAVKGESGHVYKKDVCDVTVPQVTYPVDVGQVAASVAVGESGVYAASTDGITRLEGPSAPTEDSTPGKTSGAFSRFIYWIESWIP